MKKIRQRGFTLLELLLVIGLVAIMTILDFQSKKLEMDQMQARTLGMELFRYNVAVQRYVAHASGEVDPSTVIGTKTGVNWLKDSSCGGTAPSGYLSCNFLKQTGTTTFGKLTFTTVITHNPNEGFTARTKMSQLKLGGKQRGDISGLAALVASGAYVVKDQPSPPLAQDGSVIYCPDIASVASNIQALCLTDRDHIILFARNLSAQDKWLRVDHGNVMQNVLEFRTGDITPATIPEIDVIDKTKRQIRNVARIYNLGNSNGNGNYDNLYLGRKYGETAKGMSTISNNAVIVDADQEILGRLKVMESIEAKKEIKTTDGNIIALDSAGGNNSANAGNVIAQHDIWAKDNLIADNKLLVGIDATIGRDLQVIRDTLVGGNATIKGFTQSQRYYDINDNAFYLEPSKISKLNTVDVNKVRSIGDKLIVQGGEINLTAKNGTAPVKLTGNVDINNFLISLTPTNSVSLMELLPKYVHKDTVQVAHGGLVAKPICKGIGAVPKIIITPMASSVNGINRNNGGADPAINTGWVAYAAHYNANSWVAYIRGAAANLGDGLGIATTYCQYKFN